MGTKVGEFFVDLVVDAASGNLSVRQLIMSIGELEATALGGVYGLGKIGNALATLAENTIAAATGFDQFGIMTHMSWEKLKDWQIQAKLAGMSTSAITQSVDGYVSAMAKAKKGERGVLFSNVNPLNAKGEWMDFFDYMKKVQSSEFFKTFMGGGVDIQRELLGSIGASKEMLILFDRMNKGEFKIDPSRGMSREQEKTASAVGKIWREMGQEMSDVVMHLETGGGIFLSAMKGALDLLKEFDAILTARGWGAKAKEAATFFGDISGITHLVDQISDPKVRRQLAEFLAARPVSTMFPPMGPTTGSGGTIMVTTNVTNVLESGAIVSQRTARQVFDKLHDNAHEKINVAAQMNIGSGAGTAGYEGLAP